MKPNEPAPIVCGTDFSENAMQAATAAAVLAMRSGRSLVLVHVADEFDRFGKDKEELAAHLRPRRKQLRAEAERLRQGGVTVDEKLLTGKLAERAMLEFAKEQSVALVVVSSVSKVAFDRWTLGTVSESVAQSVTSPTLVVRSAAPFEAWARVERPLKIFLATDCASVTEAAVEWVGDLRTLGPCEIVVAHLDRQAEEQERLGLSGAATFLENLPEVQRLLERDVREKCRAQLGEENLRIVVEPTPGRPDARLIELAVAAQSDLLVVGTHQRQGLDRVGHLSVSRSILRHAPMSVVCVPGVKFSAARARIPEIRRVLVATDFSELGDRAVPHAYALAREGGTVFLLHVTAPMPLPNPLSLDLGSKVDKALEKHTARLRALIPSGVQKRGVASEVAGVEPSAPKVRPPVGMYYGTMGEAHVIESADPAKAICQAAERFDADVICLGSHGRTGLAKTFLGSVAQGVMEQSRRSVLLVRTHE